MFYPRMLATGYEHAAAVIMSHTHAVDNWYGKSNSTCNYFCHM